MRQAWQNRRATALVMASDNGLARLFSRVAGRAVLSVAAAVLFLWLLAHRLHDLDLAATIAAVSHLGAMQWAAAGLATAISFWALGRYDDVMHRHLGTGWHGAASVRAGAAAIAVSQSLGFGLVTGALMRWRLLPGLSLWQATRLTAAVSGGFLLAWAVITLVALALLPTTFLTGTFQNAALWALPLLVALPLLWRLPLAMPNAFLSLRLLIFASLDLGAATLALWLLCPPEAALSLSALLPAYLLALGAGLISGAPGGLGAFEVTILTLLPATPEAPMVAAIVAFRAVYYALPAMLGALALLRPAAMPVAEHMTALQHAPAPHLAEHAHRAETLLIRQGEHRLLRAGPTLWLTGRSRHLLAALFDPVAGPPDMAHLARVARAEARLPVVYKASGRTAAQARQQGFLAFRIAREAVLSPDEFTLDGSARAGLRRKLRLAATAGVTIREGDPLCLPLAEMARVNADWAASRGGERGFSMGRFAPDYLHHQRVFLARYQGVLVAFVSFHAGRQEWALDLLRHDQNAPDGSLQALIHAALTSAAQAGVPSLTLAALPDLVPLPPWLRHRAEAGAAGLARFKQSFAPHWRPLYLIAPNLPAAILAGLGLRRAIHCPPPLPPEVSPAPAPDRRLQRGPRHGTGEAIRFPP